MYQDDRNLGFHHHDQLELSPDMADLLDEIGRHPIVIFRA